MSGDGGWLSGASATTRPVQARHILPGDRILLDDDGAIATVTSVIVGPFRIDGELTPGALAIAWAIPGTGRSGQLHRRGSDTVHAIAEDPR